MLADRIARLVRYRTDLQAQLPQGPMHELQRLYFDTASVTNAPAWNALSTLADPSHILFGNDYPLIGIEDTVQGLDDLHLSEQQHRSIGRENARMLFPRVGCECSAIGETLGSAARAVETR